MSKFTVIKHTIRFTVILILVFYFGAIAVLRVPAVQDRLTAYAAQKLRELFQTEVSIGHIDLGLLNRVIIQNVNMKDREGKDLLRISRFSAKVELSSLLHGKIRISSIQLFGLNAKLNRPSPDRPANFQFVIDALSPGKDPEKKDTDIDLRINAVLIRRGQIGYDLLSAPETPGKFNASHIGIHNLSATLSLKALTNDTLNAQIRRMSFNEQSGFKLKKLTLKVTANRQHLAASNLQIGLPATVISLDTLSAYYGSKPEFPKPGKDFRYAGKLQASITPSDLSAFVPSLKHFQETIRASLSFQGKGYQVECRQFRLTNADNSFSIRANGAVKDWNDKNRMYLSSNVSHISINEKGVHWLTGNLTGQSSVPPIVQRIKSLHFNGNLAGRLNRLTTQGTLSTQVGSVKADITMHTDSATHRHSYSGRITSRKLNLGELFNQEKHLGNAGFDIELKGFKYHNRGAESYIKGVVSSLEYNQYEYRNIALDGQYTPGGFNGKLSLDDRNGKVEINGQFVTSQRLPDFNLKAVVRNFRPYDLHLTRKYKDTDISLNLTADFSGHSIDDMQGQISIDQLSVNSSNDDNDYFLSNLSISAGNVTEQEKQITIRSPFVNGLIRGNYSYRTLPASILKTLQRYAPSLLSTGKELPETNNNFHFGLKVENAELLAKVLGIPVELNMPATLEGYFDDTRTRLQIHGYLPEFTYNNTYYESGMFLCENTAEELQCQLRTHRKMKKGAMINFSLSANVKDDRLRTILNWGNNTSSTYSGKVEALTQFQQSGDQGQLRTTIDIQPSNIVLSDTVWRIHPSRILIDKDLVEIDNFLFEHKDQYLKANGKIGRQQSDSCLVDLSNINLQYVMDIIQFHAVKFNGMATGKLRLYHVLDNPVMHARLNVQGFSLNDALLGNADIKGEWDKDLGGVRLQADIRETQTLFTKVNGYISPKEKGLDLNIQAGGTNLAFLQPFIQNIFTDVKGRVHGNVRLFGPFAKLDLEGTATADIGMKVNILNTYFQAHGDSIHIAPGEFAFKRIQIFDPEGHKGTVDGTLRHTKLKNLTYDFRFKTDNMLVYHTNKETPDFPFYGKIYTTGDVMLRGGNNTLRVDGSLRTDARTSFVYVTATAAEATSSQFITFVDKTPRRNQEEVYTELYHHLNKPEQDETEETPGDTHINLQIEATPAATMKVVMDPLGGDYISANGEGNLQINYYNKGEFKIFGNYNIEEGTYKMSMQNVIRKDFSLQPGGMVSFNGDPLQANLNVQAVYTVNSASLNDLVADASSTKGTVKVNCLLNLSGILTSPTLSFDLDLPTVSDEDRELVRSLTSTEEQMNTQIIYLLGIGKFYTYDYANNANQSSSATSSLAFSTLSGQLNNMLSQVIDSQNWNLGTNLSTGQEGWTDVEAEAILSGRLLNNRLIINGNFGYRDNPMRNTNFVGDFEAMWLLTKNGEFRLKGYNQTNDRYFTKSTLTTQGIGLMYKKDFTNWRDLFDWLLLQRRGRRGSDKK